MTNREYLKSCLHTKSYEEDFIKFMLAIQIDACATSREHFTDTIGNIFPSNTNEWKQWLSEEATESITNVNKIMNKLEEKGWV